jgi:homoserine kinase
MKLKRVVILRRAVRRRTLRLLLVLRLAAVIPKSKTKPNSNRKVLRQKVPQDDKMNEISPADSANIALTAVSQEESLTLTS